MTSARLARLGWVAGALGCSTPGTATTTPAADITLTAASAAALPPPPEARPFQTLNAALEAELCAGREPCHLLRTTPATRDPSVAVALLALGSSGQDEAPPLAQSLESKDGSDTFAASYGNCRMFEYWRVTHTGPTLGDKRLLAAVCNDGHGAASVGEDAIFFDGERFERNKSGGSSWRWAYTSAFSIAPLRPLSSSSHGFWSLQDNQGMFEWDWASFGGRYEWLAPRCNAPPQTASQVFEGPLVPEVTIDGDFTEDGWRSSRLGTCSLSVEEGASASLKVVASGRKVFVEVHDDVLTSATAKASDELALSFLESAPSYFDSCAEMTPPSVLTVRAADGKSRGSAEASVELIAPANPGEPLRAMFTLAKRTDTFTVTYRDSDDGQRHAGRVETSALAPKDAATLGQTFRVPPGLARCELRDGQLTPRVEVSGPADAELTDGS